MLIQVTKSHGYSFYQLDQELFNSPDKLAKKTIVPSKFVVIDKQDGKLFINDDDITKGQKKCFMSQVSSKKLKFDNKYSGTSKFKLSKSPSKNLMKFFILSRVDMILDISKKKKAEIYLWGVDKPVYRYGVKSGKVNPQKVLKKFCDQFNYDGFVAGIYENNIVHIKSSYKTIDGASQAVVFGKASSTPFVTSKQISDATAILKYIESDHDAHIFNLVSGKVKHWEKVWLILKNEKKALPAKTEP